MRESDYERLLVKKAVSMVRKFSFIGRRGTPDRLVITPEGSVFWVEMKAKGGKLSALQKREHEALKNYHQTVCLLSSVEDVENFIKDVK